MKARARHPARVFSVSVRQQRCTVRTLDRHGRAGRCRQDGEEVRGRPPPCWTGAVQIRNKKFVKTVYEWPDTPGAQASIPGPGKKIFEYKLEVSSKVSATLGATYEQVSAGLGFEVNKTRTLTDRTEIELPKPVQYRVRAGMIYKQYQFDVYKERGFWNWHGDYPVCFSHLKKDWVKQGTGTALKPWMEAFRKTKAPKRTTH
jgi:hypothetical protein